MGVRVQRSDVRDQRRPVSGVDGLSEGVSDVLADFTQWLNSFGETSWDHQSFFAGLVSRRAKSLYYRNRLLGTVAVAPMIFFEAFLPSARRLFHHPVRFPIADAHYAMGFAFLYEATGDLAHLESAVHFLTQLTTSRCLDFKEYCWGYPFDWVTRNGILKAHTPLITTTPYVYEAFLQVTELVEGTTNPEDRGQMTEDSKQKADERFGQRPSSSQHSTLNSQLPVAPKSNEGGSTSQGTNEYKQILESIARHAANDIKDFRTSETASSCSYTPYDSGGVINAAAYRAFLLTSASRVLSKDEYWRIAERNLNFVLENQNPDGSWPYAVDGVRDFVDHFHTCFVMKALVKIHALTGHEACEEALARGVAYYLENLFDEDGLPKPFSTAPRLIVYKCELYDCAECINLCLLLRDRFPQLETTLETVVAGILKDWIKPDGSFRSRRLLLGWDNVPMHRWGQAQMFRSLAFYVCEASKHRYQKSEVRGQKPGPRNQIVEERYAPNQRTEIR
jgi:hypothetical protein